MNSQTPGKYLLAINLLAICLIATLTGCADRPKVIQPKGVDLASFTPIKKLAVVLESAPIANNCLNAAKTYEDFVRPALKTRIPEIFKVNGIVVSDVSMQPVRENYQRDAQGNLRLPTLKQVNERYALVMVGRPGGLPMGDCFVKNEDRSIAFTVDANLWDVESGKVLWSASVTFPLVKSKVVSDTDQYIFEVLNLLHTAGYIQFSSGQAIPAPRPSK